MPNSESALPKADLLLVDDTPANLHLLSSLLRQRGYNIRATLSGKLALDAVKIQVPDLILLDIKMPEMDGFEVCAELKRHPESREIPVIFISALDEPMDKVRAFELGGVDFIGKPFEPTEVFARVQTHLAVARTALQLEQLVQDRTAELASSEARFRTLFESSRDAVMTLAPPSWSYTSANPSTLEAFKVDDEAHLNKLTMGDLSPESQPSGANSQQKAMEMIELAMHEGSCYFDWTFRRTDDKTFPATVLLTRMTIDGETLLQANVRDITAQRQAELQFSHIVQTSIDGFWITNQDGRLLDVNDACCQMLAYSRRALLGSEITISDIEVVAPHQKPGDNIKTIVEQGSGRFETQYRRKDGIIIDVQISARYINDNQHIFAFIQDITDRKKAERRLRETAVVFENTSEGVLISDAEGKVTDINTACLQIIGYTEEEVIGSSAALWKSDHHDKLFYRSLETILTETDQWRGEIWFRRKNGEVFPALQNINTVRDEKGKVTHYISLISDMSKIKGFEQRLQFLSQHDPLTSLPNRQLFETRLEHAIQSAGNPFSILSIDLDDFKSVNDVYGHPTGDDILLEIAKRLQSFVPEEDTVARIGGDEFVILIETPMDANEIAKFADKLRHVVAEPVNVRDRHLHIPSSIGISIHPEDGTDVTTLLQHADTALHQAKSQGKNRYAFYAEELTSAAAVNLQLENDLRDAVLRQEFFLVYQPQYILKTRRSIGVEALIRWNHPLHGVVPPDKFIPLAERTGLINSIGEWILTTACQDMKEWLEKGLDIGRISVNLSGKQIQGSDIVKTVRNLISETGLKPEALELEITESSILEQSSQSIEILDQLRSLGISLAMDDFGTGYSSLSYLKRLPVDRLKIDKSFIRDITSDSEALSIARSVIALGKSLNLATLAEGVETAEQENLLVEEGCDEAQGFLFAKPLSADELVDYLAKMGTP